MQDVVDLLVETGFDPHVLDRIGEKLRTPAATCFRVNTLQADVNLVARELEELCLSSCGFRPSIFQHPLLRECLILPPRFNPKFDAEVLSWNSGQSRTPERVVLVGRLCGEAVLQVRWLPSNAAFLCERRAITTENGVLHHCSYTIATSPTLRFGGSSQAAGGQGADVFAPGVAAAPADLREGEPVAVFADITDCVQRGGVTAGLQPNPNALPLCSSASACPLCAAAHAIP